MGYAISALILAVVEAVVEAVVPNEQNLINIQLLSRPLLTKPESAHLTFHCCATCLLFGGFVETHILSETSWGKAFGNFV